MIVFVAVVSFALFKTRYGLHVRAVGEHPRAAATVGIDVIRVRYINVVLGRRDRRRRRGRLHGDPGPVPGRLHLGARLHRPRRADLRSLAPLGRGRRLDHLRPLGLPLLQPRHLPGADLDLLLATWSPTSSPSRSWRASSVGCGRRPPTDSRTFATSRARPSPRRPARPPPSRTSSAARARHRAVERRGRSPVGGVTGTRGVETPHLARGRARSVRRRRPTRAPVLAGVTTTSSKLAASSVRARRRRRARQ